ncbi:sugar phosphate isomerase/epimerase family protein [Maribacter sp. ACAM166]|uniref:sugar phosphate isomerase/epimerase family protein n=1 Tax=Maribacter sp. ACAM166 TaxID=2508996 RepID=UPI0010FF2DC8|nr:TIM barrel protein [Maribacter sp. ACAM166]TLP72980.1 sugar phosphate isomerase/epimerase [Maribacter sp. ACAM166]
MKTNTSIHQRRSFLKKSTALLAGTTLLGPSLFGAPSFLKYTSNSKINGVQIGVITYSFRSMPDQSAEATLQYILDSGINAVELMGDPAEQYAGKPKNPIDRNTFYSLMRRNRNNDLNEEEQKEFIDIQAKVDQYNKVVADWRASVSMEKFKALRKMYNEAGVRIYAFKPNAFSKNNTDSEINWGMKAAKALGASHVTLEHPSDDGHTLKLSQIAAKYDIFVAYHGHEQQTPTFWDTALEQSDHNAINLDLGHFVAAGNEAPLNIVKEKHSHIMSMHLKDRRTPEHHKGNVLWGTGDTPIVEVLQLMRDEKYTFPATIELEYDIPEGSDAVQEVKKCLTYAKQALES